MIMCINNTALSSLFIPRATALLYLPTTKSIANDYILCHLNKNTPFISSPHIHHHNKISAPLLQYKYHKHTNYIASSWHYSQEYSVCKITPISLQIKYDSNNSNKQCKHLNIVTVNIIHLSKKDIIHKTTSIDLHAIPNTEINFIIFQDYPTVVSLLLQVISDKIWSTRYCPIKQ